VIPFQAIGDGLGPASCLSWVEAGAIPFLTHDTYKATPSQVIRTFYHLAATFRIHVPYPTVDAFMQAATPRSKAEEYPNFMLRLPFAYFRCSENDQYLRFDWFAYAAQELGGTS